LSSCQRHPTRKVVLLIQGQGDWPRQIDSPLRDAGYIVFEAFSARDARAALNAWRVDFIIADLFLRDDTGFNFSRRVKEVSPHTRVYLVSSMRLALKIASKLSASRQLPAWGRHNGRQRDVDGITCRQCLNPIHHNWRGQETDQPIWRSDRQADAHNRMELSAFPVVRMTK
jgi:CheY-like chemotaxis protein